MDLSNKPGIPSYNFLVDFIRILVLGCVLVIEALWERLGIGKELRDIYKAKKTKVPYERALLAMAANRLCESESKLGVWDRWLSKVYLPTCDSLKLEQMYEDMDLLYDHWQLIEKNIFFHTANLFNLKVDLPFTIPRPPHFQLIMEMKILMNPMAVFVNLANPKKTPGFLRLL